ncbi:hypothetical protein BKA56DRAFT_589549 [Ilyonectria sp. MPI-CAGE-AT-0026]|nr:hypothetical protein BKA56DRAFT_589549 [Ilyonectria sp. MPI-CAGE-AT-0026]
MSIIRSRATPPTRPKHASRFCVPYESFVGAFIGDSYRLLLLAESGLHADVFLISHLENPTTILRAHAYILEGLCPQLRQSRKRHIKRHSVDILSHIYQNGRLFVIFKSPHSEEKARTLTKGSKKQQKLQSQTATRLDDLPNVSSLPTLCLTTATKNAALMIKHLELVLMTTNDVVNGQSNPNYPHSSLDSANQSSQQLEDALREARSRLYRFLQFPKFQQDCEGRENPKFLEHLMNWDKVDFRYRQLLYKDGEIQPYREAISDIYNKYGSLSYLRQIEHCRQSRWESFLKSMASGSSDVAGLMGGFDAERINALAPIRASYATMLNQKFPWDPLEQKEVPISQKTDKQRDKRRKRRERIREARKI